MYSDFGDSLNYLILRVVPAACIAAGAVALAIGVGIAWSSKPSEQDVIRERERQQVIESLTPRQREALGLSR